MVMRIRVAGLAVPVGSQEEIDVALRLAVAARLGVATPTVGEMQVVQRALDARRRLRYVCAVDVAVEAALAHRCIAQGKAYLPQPVRHRRLRLRRLPGGPPPVVVGAGPAGLFAALILAEAGWPPILLERGKPVETRGRDVSRLYRSGELDPDSNVCFGEGGAGTFSDGKLYTRVNDGRVRAVLTRLVELGAKESILVDNRPHLGTDRLVVLLKALRAHLRYLGVVVRFGTSLQRCEITAGEMTAAILRDGERLETGQLVLATGHSARDVFAALEEASLRLQARPFAVGFRVEHPQALIDRMRYGKEARRACLPAADYRLTHQPKGGGRGVYSFCMCPGGVVVATPTSANALCINGMSHAARDGRFANSALVVQVAPQDFATWGHVGDRAGESFQRAVERDAYARGGGSFRAPAARLTDFLAGRESGDLGATSYRRGLTPARLDTLYPPSVVAALKEAIRSFDRRMRGFLTEQATLIGVETRTASPVRLPRDETLQAVGARGLYPAGEGLGYGGGIVSAAVDGMRVAEAMLIAQGAEEELLELA